MLQFMLHFIQNNIYYIVPLLGIFTISAIYSAKARSVVLVLLSSILLVGLSFVINRYSTNNENVRSILISIVTLFTNVFHLLVYAFLINVYFFQIRIYVFFYTMAFSFIIRIVFHAIHCAFVIKGIFKKAFVLFERIRNAFYSYIKNFITNSFLGSFYQVMRI